MKELGKWQIISFLSRGMAMVLGLIQSFVIIRVLSVTEWGLVQLAVSIGGALGIYQHLGLASASTREISSAKNDEQIFKIFVTSVFIRYLVTLPISFGLFFFSRKIAVGLYNNELLVFPLQIYSITLLFQGFQSILNSVVAGTKRFKQLFTYQVGIACISVLLYIPLVYFYRINGYFYALFIFNVINTLALGVMAFFPLKGKLVFPDFKDFSRLLVDIFSISMGIYLVKILYTNWEKLGNNLLGLFNTTEVIGIYAFALLYAKKLMSISDSVTDVNLPVLSDKFVHDKKEFRSLFSENFNKIFIFIILSASFATYWAPEIVRVLVGGDKYELSYVLIPPIILAFILYSLINIIKSSVLIPAKLVKEMILSFVILICGTGLFFLIGKTFFSGIIAMSWSMAFGSLISFMYMLVVINNKLKYLFFNKDHLLLLVQAFFIGWAGLFGNLMFKSITFLPFFGLLVWGIFESGFTTKKELLYYIGKVVDKVKVRKGI